MNQSEAVKLVSMLKAVYLREPFTADSPAAYHWLLDDLPFEAVMVAAQLHARRSKWCPTPAELREIVTDQAMPKTPAGDAWDLVLKAVRRHGRSGFEDVTFDDPAILAAVRRVGWRRICDDERPELVRRDFDAALASAQAEFRRDVQSGQIDAPRLRAIS